MVEMAQLGIVRTQFHREPVLQSERDAAVRDRGDLSSAVVDEAELGIVASPADAVPGEEPNSLSTLDLHTSAAPGEFARLPQHGPAVLAFDHHRAGFMIDARDGQFIALADARQLVRTVERDDIPGPVIGRKGLLRVGVAVRDQPLALQGRAINWSSRARHSRKWPLTRWASGASRPRPGYMRMLQCRPFRCSLPSLRSRSSRSSRRFRNS